MTVKQLKRRMAAVKTADAINAIEGVPVSDYARTLSLCWARGEITGEQMKAALLAHRRMAEQVKRKQDWNRKMCFASIKVKEKCAKSALKIQEKCVIL